MRRINGLETWSYCKGDRQERYKGRTCLRKARKYKRPLHHRISANRNRTYYDLKYHQQRGGSCRVDGISVSRGGCVGALIPSKRFRQLQKGVKWWWWWWCRGVSSLYDSLLWYLMFQALQLLLERVAIDCEVTVTGQIDGL